MPADLPTLTPAQLARYSRHIQLGELGVDGQRRLAAARVLIVGAGGLGSPAALYLAAAGVGTIGIADFDRVATHNLQRQLLHNDATVGQPKVDSAAARLRATNPHIKVLTHPEGVTADNALALFADYDVILDGTDNFSARYLNNDAAFFAGRPLVFGSIFKFEGQVTVFHSAAGGPCYRCLFPEAPAAGSVPGCGEAGVLGALCGVIGSLQALEVLKLLTGVGQPLTGRLLTYDALAPQVQTLSLPRDPHCPLCGPSPTIRTLPACTAVCAAPPPMSTDACPLEITVTEARQLLDTAADRVQLIDVREPFEVAICQIPDSELIPLRQIPEHATTLPKDRHLLILCHHGARSLRATEFLRARGYEAVSSIAGGIDAWAEQIDPTMARY